MPCRGVGDAALYAREYPAQIQARMFNEYTQHHFVKDRDNPFVQSEGTDFAWVRDYQLGGESLTCGGQSYR